MVYVTEPPLPFPSLLDLSASALASSTHLDRHVTLLTSLPRHLKDRIRHFALLKANLSSSCLTSLIHDRVSDLDLVEIDPLTTDHVREALMKCSTSLKKLNVNDTKVAIPPDVFGQQMASLKVLYLRRAVIDDEGLEAMARNCPNLRVSDFILPIKSRHKGFHIIEGQG